MSSSELGRLSDELGALARACAAGDDACDQLELAALLGAVSRLYAAGSSDPYGAEALAALDLTTTDACTVASVMLRSQSLTPFEFSIWFSGGRLGGGA